MNAVATCVTASNYSSNLASLLTGNHIGLELVPVEARHARWDSLNDYNETIRGEAVPMDVFRHPNIGDEVAVIYSHLERRYTVFDKHLIPYSYQDWSFATRKIVNLALCRF